MDIYKITARGLQKKWKKYNSTHSVFAIPGKTICPCPTTRDAQLGSDLDDQNRLKNKKVFVRRNNLTKIGKRGKK
jgi:hypothetical protein